MERELINATENPTEAKAMMLKAMCSNDVLGIPIAAMQRCSDAAKWADDAVLYQIEFSTHAEWMLHDDAYSKRVIWLEKEGLKAQKQGHWACGLGMMADDAQIWKTMLAEFNRLEAGMKKPENEEKSPFEGIETEVLLEALNLIRQKNIKAV